MHLGVRLRRAGSRFFALDVAMAGRILDGFTQRVALLLADVSAVHAHAALFSAAAMREIAELGLTLDRGTVAVGGALERQVIAESPGFLQRPENLDPELLLLPGPLAKLGLGKTQARAAEALGIPEEVEACR